MPQSRSNPFTRPVEEGDRNRLKIDATTAHDIKWGRYIIVCKVFFAKRFPISFKKIDTMTAVKVVINNFIILSSNVFLNALQNASVLNIHPRPEETKDVQIGNWQFRGWSPVRNAVHIIWHTVCARLAALTTAKKF